jgi:hypothetical protein
MNPGEEGGASRAWGLEVGQGDMSSVLEGGWGPLRRGLWQWKGHTLGAWIRSMHHHLLWLPPQIPYEIPSF